VNCPYCWPHDSGFLCLECGYFYCSHCGTLETLAALKTGILDMRGDELASQDAILARLATVTNDRQCPAPAPVPSDPGIG
jgi:hypothetical protein